MKQLMKSILALSMAASMMIPQAVFADSVTDIQEASSDTATITLGKVLTVNQKGKFPDLSDYNFELEAVKAWDNANASASANGTVINKADIPMPTTTDTSHHSVDVSESKASISVGDFRGSSGNTKVADTETQKFRTTDVNIKYTKAGYYMYKVHEILDESKRVPGVSYDPNNYYVIVYVCNNVDDEGNTVPGVYVHDITSYRNDPTGNIQPNLSDIANTTDNGGKEAVENTVENFAKVGKSDPNPGEDPGTGIPQGPDKLEAYKFWNYAVTHDVVITNNVKGNLGDVSKAFEYTVELTGLEPNKTYYTNEDAAEKTAVNHTSAGTVVIAGSKGTVDTTNKAITSDADGKAVFGLKLKDNDVLVINSLPVGATYKVVERASDHVASYTVESTRPDTALIVKSNEANNADNLELATQEESVEGVANGQTGEKNDGTITVTFTNKRDIATITGIAHDAGHYLVLLVMLILAGATVMTVINRRMKQAVYEAEQAE